MRRQKFQRVTHLALTLVLLVSTGWAAEYKVLYAFQDEADGSYARGVVFDASGNLYGATFSGGDYDEGAVLELTPNPDGSWSKSVIYSFGLMDGFPGTDLTFDVAGNLYGMTSSGGSHYDGTVFKLTPNPDGSWSESTIYSLPAQNGCAYDRLTLDTTGALYGTTEGGGAHNYGTVFKLAPNPDGSWTRSRLHTFQGHDGANPCSGVVLDGSGNLYGTTWMGGTHNQGTVFRLSPNPDGSWTRTKLHDFKGSDGAYPLAGLILDAAGNLYGTTMWGGPHFGTAFKLSPNPDGSWTRSTLHNFRGHDGAAPSAELIFDPAGNVYGTTFQGGTLDLGTVFRLSPNPDGSWTRNKLHDFKGPEGAYPVAGLTLDAAGNLYGTTNQGGKGFGVVFRITP